METRTVNIESLLLHGVFDIPRYQRSYSWEKRQLNDLLDDIRYLPEDRKHFFGNIILEKKDDKYKTNSGRRLDVYQVVDGQQRLTTALIFLYVASSLDDTVKQSAKEANLIKLPQERPRLLPQDQDKEFFRDSLLGDISLNSDTPSQKRLETARDHLYNRLSDLEEELPVSELADRLKYDFQINVVEVDEGSEAASIFESINDRGKPLSSLEKTKSFLMYMDDRAQIHRSLQSRIDERFGKIYRDLFVLEEGHDRIDDFDEDSFQQFHWGIYDDYDSDEYSNNLETLKSRLHKKYRSGDLDGVQSVIDEYSSSLREASSAFADLFYPTLRPDSVQASLTRLLELGRLANVLPVLIAAQLEYGDDDPEKMAKIVEKCETLVFRVYAIDGRRSDTGQGKLVRLAHELNENSDHDFQDTIQRLENITRDYTDDERFERKLHDEDFYNSISSRDIRYLLYHYGQQLEADDKEFVRRDLSQILSSEFQVEHVLAQELSKEFIPDDLKDEFEDHIHRLGNLTIAGRYWNGTYGDLPFDDKKKVPDSNKSDREKAYEKSNLKVQHVLADIDEFNREAIKVRENTIVEFALNEWSLDTEPKETMEPVNAIDLEELKEIMTIEGEERKLSETELFVLKAVLSDPGRSLRSIHSTAAESEDSPIEYTNEWSEQREKVQNALHDLKDKNAVYLQQRSWYPDIDIKNFRDDQKL